MEKHVTILGGLYIGIGVIHIFIALIVFVAIAGGAFCSLLDPTQTRKSTRLKQRLWQPMPKAKAKMGLGYRPLRYAHRNRGILPCSQSSWSGCNVLGPISCD